MNIIKIPEKTITLPRMGELAGGIAVALLARASLPGMQPVGLAFAAAMPPGGAAVALIGLCIGGGGVFKYAIAFLLYNVLIFLHRSESRNVKTAALAVSVVGAGGISLLHGGASDAGALLIIPEALLTVCLYRLFTYLGKKNDTGRLAAAVAAGGILNGFMGINIPYINAGAAVLAGFFGVMSLCYACTMPWAVFLSGVLGFMMYADSGNAILMSGAFAAAAVFSSLLTDMGRLGTAVGFLCGVAVSVLYIGRIDFGIADIFVPLTLFALLPEAVHQRISEALAGRVDEGEDTGLRIAGQLDTVAKAVGDLAEGVTVLKACDCEDAIIREMADTVWERVCAGCSLEESCQSRENRRNYENIGNLWHAMESDGYCDYSNIPQEFFQTCVRSERFLREFNHAYEIYKQDVLHSGEALSGRDIIARQYTQIAGVIRVLSRDIRAGYVGAEAGEPVYRVTVTSEQEPKNGQTVCGDTLMHFEKDGKYFVILCDGMGSGESALSESRLTARLFAEFLKAGFKKETALDMINSALALKADQESFSTVDLLEINLETGVAEFLKVGSAQSFLKTKSKIEEISSKALPVGILESVDAEAQSYELKNNDMILMVSDGVGEAGSGVMKSDWIKRLMMMENRSDAELAQLILVGAKVRMKFSDDITGVVIRIKRRRGEVNESSQ